jgi:protocatechuate 3,4-dioxygenase beta subunit
MIALLAFLAVALQQGEPAPTLAPKDAPWKVSVAAKDEPGDRLVVTGRVVAEDGKTPLAGVSLFVYQTDKTGVYSRPVDDNRRPRLRGYLRTDAQGRYEYETIKPASYPNGRTPAHIHYVVNGPGFKEKIFEIVFDDDPFVDQRIRENAKGEGSVFSIRPLTRDAQGILRCTQDIQLKK